MTTTTEVQPKQLDCGHMSTPRGIAAGYATDRAGATLCYDCAAELDRAQVRSMTSPAGRLFAYVQLLEPLQTGPGYMNHGDRATRIKVTTWAGVELGRGTFGPISYDGFGHKRRHVLVKVEGVEMWAWYYPESGDHVNLRPYARNFAKVHVHTGFECGAL